LRPPARCFFFFCDFSRRKSYLMSPGFSPRSLDCASCPVPFCRDAPRGLVTPIIMTMSPESLQRLSDTSRPVGQDLLGAVWIGMGGLRFPQGSGHFCFGPPFSIPPWSFRGRKKMFFSPPFWVHHAPSLDPFLIPRTFPFLNGPARN